MKNNTLKIFSGRSNPSLAKEIANTLNRKLGKVSIRTFADGEIWVKYEENIRGRIDEVILHFSKVKIKGELVIIVSGKK